MSNLADAAALFGAWSAGQAAARLRLGGGKPTTDSPGNPEDHGAFQWADACGYRAGGCLRSTFSQAFVATIQESRQ